MKLLSCHIENFGKLHDLTYDFSDGANVICKDNGWGKSTFASFIRAMFFGLEGDRKRTLNENERKRFAPWQGGAFGGSVSFTVHGKSYTMYRVFKDKDVNDEFELRDYNTNLISNDYSDRIGEEIFKINRESFMNTVFLGQNSADTSPTDDINAKIGNLSENSNDLNNFDVAYERLDRIMKDINPSRVTGSINRRRKDIAELEYKIRSSSGITDTVDEITRLLDDERKNSEDIREKIKYLSEKQGKVMAYESVNARKDIYAGHKQEVSTKREEMDALLVTFPSGVPQIDELKREQELCVSLREVKERQTNYALNDTEKEELIGYKRAFALEVPKQDDILSMSEKTQSLAELKARRNSTRMTEEESSRLNILKGFFGGENTKCSDIIRSWNERNIVKSSMSSDTASLSALRQAYETQTSIGGFLVLIILGAILVAGGAGGYVITSNTLFLIATIVGFILALTWLILVLNRKSGKKNIGRLNEIKELENRIEANNSLILETDRMVMDYLSRHNRACPENEVGNVLQEIMQEEYEYSALLKKEQIQDENNCDGEINTLTGEIGDYLLGFGITPNEESYNDDISRLKNSIIRYNNLIKQENAYDKAYDEYMIKSTEIIEFLARYQIMAEADLNRQFTGLISVAERYMDVTSELNEAEEKLRDFEEKNDVNLLQNNENDLEIPSISELQEQMNYYTEELDAVGERIRTYNSQLERLREEYDAYEDNIASLAELKELQNKEEEKYRLVKLAAGRLSLARERITSRYSDPIMRSFVKYYETVTCGSADGFSLDANTRITRTEGGKQREVGAFSSGYQDLINISLRLALVDAMYPNESPVIIMDDPFVNLDDDKTKAGMNLIDTVAKEYQVIYFTCSNYRR